MAPKSMNLAWIVVNDIKQAVKFYTETVGLKLMEFHEDFGWAELEGKDGGARIGLAQTCADSQDDVKPGQNAVVTFTVDNLEKVVADLTSKGTKLVGKVQIIPDHVKMQTVSDIDGNKFQLVELLYKEHSCGCC